MYRYRLLIPLVAALGLAACDEPPTSPLVATPASEDRRDGPTEAVDLGTLGGARSVALDINDQEIIVGWSLTSDGSTHAFRWTRKNGMEDLGTLGGSFSQAIGVNRRGFIAGISTDASGATHLVMWSPDGSINDLGDFGAWSGSNPLDVAYVVDVNDRNEIVGNYAGGGFSVPFHWTQRTGIVDYPWKAGREAYVEGVNNHGDVVGWWCCGIAEQLYGVFFSERGVGFLDVGAPETGVPPSDMLAIAYAVNDHRVVVGWDASLFFDKPFRWSLKDGFEFIGENGVAINLNNRGEIVGSTVVAEGVQRGFFWSRARGMVLLTDGTPLAINERSVMAGVRFTAAYPFGHATLWRGTQGIPVASAVALDRAGDRLITPAETCLTPSGTARSKATLLRCLAEAR